VASSSCGVQGFFRRIPYTTTCFATMRRSGRDTGEEPPPRLSATTSRLIRPYTVRGWAVNMVAVGEVVSQALDSKAPLSLECPSSNLGLGVDSSWAGTLARAEQELMRALRMRCAVGASRTIGRLGHLY